MLFLGLSETVLSQSGAFGIKRASRTTSANTSDTTKRFGCGSLKQITDPKEMPLYVVNNHQIPPESQYIMDLLNHDNFEDIRVFQKDDSISKSYGDIGKNGVIRFTLKRHKKLLTLEQVLKKYKIDKSEWSLNVCIDKKLIETPQILIFDLSAHFNIEVISGEYWANGQKINSTGKFINIVTGYYP